ncbi:TPA: hypothetical protein QHZ98_003371 [Klebsiella oxytoca]|nr:hypothetical protein [Klebsiella oxytoca]HDS6519753.1 hypothetical protein [Klebsiella oxytoca]
MLTHQIIQSEIEELKQILAHQDLEIPSFWRCIWPGLVCMLWFLLTSYLSYWLSDYASGLERIAAMVFAGAMGFFSIVLIANTRAHFLSLPQSFRKKSKFFGYLSGKCKAYGVFILVLFPCLAFYFSSIHLNAIAFSVITFFCMIVTVMVMNIDLGRYQLATLTSVIEAVRGVSRRNN